MFRLLLVIHKKILNNVSKLNNTVTSGLDRSRFSRTFSQYLTLAFSYFDMILKRIFYFASSSSRYRPIILLTTGFLRFLEPGSKVLSFYCNEAIK